jgi:hypothetical protein
MGMPRSLTPSVVLKELQRVADELAAGKLTGEKRLALLRRQAELGDLRDAMAERQRRSAV